jgi:hypothetical protein
MCSRSASAAATSLCERERENSGHVTPNTNASSFVSCSSRTPARTTMFERACASATRNSASRKRSSERNRAKSGLLSRRATSVS